MADTGFGITIAFESGFLAEIIDTTPPEMTRDEIETTHTATTDGKKTFIMSDLIDYGELQVELNFDETAEPPIDQPFSPCVITFGSGTTWSFSGALKGYAPAAPIDDRMTATATIKVSGGITIA